LFAKKIKIKRMKKKTKFISMMAALLIGAMSMGFSSCSKDEKKEEKVPVDLLWGKWNYYRLNSEGIFDKGYFLLFNPDNTYSYMNEKETINGMYRITASEKIKMEMSYGDETRSVDASFYKILVSGSDVFDRMCIYHYRSLYPVYNSNYELVYNFRLLFEIYSGDDLIETRGADMD
jgi:hypothetical protein